jgi:23S rRNA pseudouridine1911/1915/1917 synthase
MRVRAGVGEAGMRLDAALVALAGVQSRAAAARLVERGLVTVDDTPRPKSHRVEAGEEIELLPGEPAGPVPEPAPFEIVWEDEHLLVVDKPAGVVIHPGAANEQGTLAQALAGRAAGGDDPGRAGIVHRLDRDTSGLLVVAASQPAYEALSEMVRSYALQRRYLALVEGHPEARAGTIDAPIGRDRGQRTRVSTMTDRPRSAITHFEVLERLPHTALLSVRLETGRTHQIRAHLAAIGHPVCADQRYGGGVCGRRLGLGRQFLHSARLAFSHPLTGEQIECESKTPADLLRALEAARWDPVSGGPDGG